jgi:hypothetical protein
MSALGQKRTFSHVRYTPKSGHRNPLARCPLCAISGHLGPRHHVLVHYGDRAGSKNARRGHLGEDEPVAF